MRSAAKRVAMRDPAELCVIREQLSAGEAVAMLAALVESPVSPDARRVYYPYHFFRATGSTPGLFGRRRLSLDCLVDGRSGVASTSDPFDIVRRPGGEADVLPTAVTLPLSEREARRCLTHGLGRRLRTIADFRLVLDYRGVVYKPYWLVDCGDDTVLVDSASGAWHHVEAA